MTAVLIVTVWVLAAVLAALRPSPRAAAVVSTLAGTLSVVLAVMWLLGSATAGGNIESDALSRLLVLVVASVALAGVLVSASTAGPVLASDRAHRRYWVSFNLFAAATLAVPLASNLAWTWIAVELTTLFSVLLVATSGTPGAIRAAWRYALLTLAGSSVALFGILVLAGIEAHAGNAALTWDGLSHAIAGMPLIPTRAALLLIIVGFGTKVGLVPVHTWLPGAYSEAPLPVCILFSGAETAAVLGVLVRVVGIGTTVEALSLGPWVMVLGLLTVAVGALLIVQAHDLRRLFAYSTIEQAGVVLVGTAIAGHGAVEGAVVQLLGQALTKAVCFTAVALILERTGTVELRKLGGLIGAPGGRVAVFLFGAGCLAMAGVPPSLLFLGEFTIIRAAFDAHLYVAAGILVLFLAIAAVALLWRAAAAIAGTPRHEDRLQPMASPTGRWLLQAPLSALACAVMIAGMVMPPALSDLLQRGA